MTQKIEKKDVEKLAALARITIPENEIEKVRSDMEVILAYVSQIQEANDIATSNDDDKNAGEEGKSGLLLPKEQYNFGVKNVMRDDAEPHESGMYTDTLLAAAPKTEKGYLKVKKILGGSH